MSPMDRRSWVGSVLGAGALYGLDTGFTVQPSGAAQVGPIAARNAWLRETPPSRCSRKPASR